MNSEKVKYTWWLNFIGIIGLIVGVGLCILSLVLLVVNKFTILGAFLLLSAILFLFVKREVTYLIYTGMFAILSVVRTVWPIIYPLSIYPFPYWTLFTGVPIYWLGLAYLTYKYFDFRKMFGEKEAYEKRYENLKN